MIIVVVTLLVKSRLGPNPKAEQDGRAGDEGHHGAGDKVHEATQIHEQEVANIRETTGEASYEHRVSSASPDENCANKCCQPDPQQVEAMLVD